MNFKVYSKFGLMNNYPFQPSKTTDAILRHSQIFTLDNFFERNKVYQVWEITFSQPSTSGLHLGFGLIGHPSVTSRDWFLKRGHCLCAMTCHDHLDVDQVSASRPTVGLCTVSTCTQVFVIYPHHMCPYHACPILDIYHIVLSDQSLCPSGVHFLDSGLGVLLRVFLFPFVLLLSFYLHFIVLDKPLFYSWFDSLWIN